MATTVNLNGSWAPLTLDNNKYFKFSVLSTDTLIVCDNVAKLNPIYYSKGDTFILKGMTTPYYILGKGRIEYEEYSGGGGGDTSSLAQESTLQNIDSNVTNIAGSMGVSTLVWKDVINKDTFIFSEETPIQYALQGSKLLMKGVLMFTQDRKSLTAPSPISFFTIPDPSVKNISSVQEDSQFRLAIDASGNMTDALFENTFEQYDTITFDNIEFYK